jgi:lysophospholipase L1-like esterase
MRRNTVAGGRSRDGWFKLLSVTAGVVAALLLLEAALRIAPGTFGEDVRQQLSADSRNYGIPDPYIGCLSRPDSTIVVSGRDFKAVHRVDKSGFRNTWPWPSHADIAALGDSATFGYGVANDEAWPAALSRSLGGTAVVNLALIGAGPQQYLRVYETFGAPLHPKLVLVGLWARNDFWDAEMFDRWLTSGVGDNYMVWRDFGQPERVTPTLRHPIRSLEGVVKLSMFPLQRNSRAYNLLRVILEGIHNRSGAPPRIFRFADGRSLELQMEDFVEASAKGQPEDRGFQLTVDALQRLDLLTSRAGAHTLVVLLPSKEETYGPLVDRAVVDPTRALREALAARGIDYLDLASGFRERAAAGERLFFEVDQHPNAAGCVLIARLVLSHLERHGRKYGLIDAPHQTNGSVDQTALPEQTTSNHPHA